MKIAFKLTLAITAAFFAVLLAQAYWQFYVVADLQEREIRDDVIILGRVIGAGVSEIWATSGETKATEFVDGADERRAGTSISLVPLDEFDSTRGVPAEARVEKLVDTGSWRIVAASPVVVGGTTVAVIEIIRELPREQEYFESVLASQLFMTVAAALLAGGVAVLFGYFLVGRPVRRLSELAHRVSEGNFSTQIAVTSRDELGGLARALDRMTHRLKESHHKAAKETRARAEALEQLRHADRLSTVGKLASSMAHELGTPLNVVSGRASLIAEDEQVAEDVRQNAAIVVEQAERMAAIIREVLQFARKQSFEREQTELRDVVEHAALLMRPLSEDRNVVLEVDAPERTVAWIHAGKILQVLTNTVMNALHAMPDGGRITVTIGETRVDEPTDSNANPGDFAKISVRDEGVGIPADQLDDIFEAFFSTKKKGKGTGLGLSVCHGIIREHGGWIEVESAVNEGTTFTFYLPQGEDL